MGLRAIKRWLWLGLLLLLGVGASLAWVVPEVNWRARLIMSMGVGEIDGISWGELLVMMRPGSLYYIGSMADEKNPFSVIKNPFMSVEDVSAGEVLYRENCTICHGQDGQRGTAPVLADGGYQTGDSDWAVFRTIRDGVEGTGMRPQSLSEREIWQTISYLRQPTEAKSVQALGITSSLRPFRPVTASRLTNAANEPENWLTYSGSYDGHRFSELQQINKRNVASLALQWAYQSEPKETMRQETTPLVADGRMYLTEQEGRVAVLDAATGEVLWRYQKKLPDDIAMCCGRVNRGVALSGDRLYFNTPDAHLVALDAQTGQLIWDVEKADHRLAYSSTAAPLAVKDLVIAGVAGGEFGVRGFLDAYDAQTGERVWRFNTIPSPGESGHDTWSGDSWKTGGGATWMIGSYDPGLDLVYWGTGNPSPDFNGDERSGDNLYTNSIVALDADTGELRWHRQFTPHDVHDFDANTVPVLVDLPVNDSVRKLLLMATKNGFYYVLDRETGEYLAGKAFVRQNWALEIDESGRPVPDPKKKPNDEGVLVYPTALGGTSWWPPSYSPLTRLFYLPASDNGMVVFKNDDEYSQGDIFMGGSYRMPQTHNASFIVLRALDPLSGELNWEFGGIDDSQARSFGGVLTTASDLLFWGNVARLYALDAKTGEMLWTINLGGEMDSAPMTYEVDGRQFLTVASGAGVYTFSVVDASVPLLME